MTDDDFELDDLDIEEEFDQAWSDHRREAARALTEAVAPIRRPRPDTQHLAAAADRLRSLANEPEAWCLTAAGFEDPHEVDDEALLRAATAATIEMVEDPTDALTSADASAVMTLEAGDWIAVILALLRVGPGAPADVDTLVGHVRDGIDAVVEGVDDDDDLQVVWSGLEVVLRAWRAIGVVDGPPTGERLSPLGAWVLPVAATLAWTGVEGPDDGRQLPDGWSEAFGDTRPTRFDPAIQAALHDVVADGVATTAELMAASGLSRDDLFDVMWLTCLRDARWVEVALVLDGRVLTHHLTPAESAGSFLELSGDLEVLAATHLTAGDAPSQLVQAHWRGEPADAHGLALHGPDGWLPVVAEPTLVAVRLTGTHVEVACYDGPLDEGAGTALLLQQTFVELDGENSSGGDLDLPELLLELLVQHSDVLRTPTVPVGRLLAPAGLSMDGHSVVDADDAELLADVPAYVRRGGVRAFLRAGQRLLDEPDATLDLARLAARLTNRDAAEDLVLAELGTDDLHADRLQALVTALEPVVKGQARGSVDHLAGALAEARGDARAALQSYRRAVAQHPGIRAAHERIATLLVDGGDARQAIRHWELAGYAEDEPEVAAALDLLDLGMEVGRNDPCPCRSGRKYKKCCDRRGGPLPQRMPLLIAKAEVFAHEPRQRPSRVALAIARIDADLEVADVLGRGSIDEVMSAGHDATGLVRALDDRVVSLAHLFLDGGLAGYLDARGELLPDDERELATRWLSERLRLIEVVDGPDGPTLVSDGRSLDLPPDQPPLSARAGDLAVALILADGAHDVTAYLRWIEPTDLAARALTGPDVAGAQWCAWEQAREG